LHGGEGNDFEIGLRTYYGNIRAFGFKVKQKMGTFANIATRNLTLWTF